jgi:ADP-ribosylglycohydrolase
VAVVSACAAHGDVAVPAWRAMFAAAAAGAGIAPTAFDRAFDAIAQGLDAGLGVEGFADALGCARGVPGYALQAVPVALYAAARHRDDLRAAVTSAVRCGGDTDSTAALAGAVVGASLGAEAVPADWRAGLLPWPPIVGRLARDPADAMRSAQGRPAAVEAIGLATWPLRLAGNLAVFALLVGVLVRRTAAVAGARARR